MIFEHAAAAGQSKSVSKYEFGPFVLDPISRRLWRDGEAVAITARVFDILVVLIGRQGQPVDKDVLIEQVWGDLAVEEGNLARNVSTLRKLLGEAPDDHRFIVTQPGRGYQFVARVEKLPIERLPIERLPVENELLPVAPAAASHVRGLGQLVTLAIAACVMMAVATVYAVTRPKPRLAPDRVPRITVLPFENLGRDDEQYVAAGLTEEITSRLAALDRLRLVSRAGAARYDRSSRRAGEIGADLGADYLLDGSIAFDRASADGRVRIAARLIHAADDTMVWAETFDRETADLFRVQAEIATRVVRALRGELIAGESGLDDAGHAPKAFEPSRRLTRNLDAWKAYLRGVFHVNRPDISDDTIARLEHLVVAGRPPGLARAVAGAAHDGRLAVHELRFLQALYERRNDEAVRVLKPFAGTWVRHWIFVRPVVLFEAQAWRLQGDAARAAAAFESARALLAAEAAASPGDGRLHGALASGSRVWAVAPMRCVTPGARWN